MIWVLDTDHVSLLLQGNQAVLSRVIRHYPNVAITIVTVQEIFNGWIIRINNPTQTTNLVRLYTNLWTATEYFKGERILNFDDNANAYYQRLLNENQQLNKKRLQKDLRIAAIALSVNGIMVTRNQRDFSQVPDLIIEDWTQ
ncbi:nuclease [Aphanothece hegewaldii CCALA 016]|uniref:Nuclease n=1 Tax=Aphanothece hegewaldii CCALA 016 TaxID=2107694 RepID=A0A2T1LW73_9CHRO|nr:type II toxin-antitoxin system VapC family toxin [Aphanothece hegewaldii]PSF36005.1 nuclease [Aphanothece hegewaldii CCALA 016]